MTHWIASPIDGSPIDQQVILVTTIIRDHKELLYSWFIIQCRYSASAVKGRDATLKAVRQTTDRGGFLNLLVNNGVEGGYPIKINKVVSHTIELAVGTTSFTPCSIIIRVDLKVQNFAFVMPQERIPNIIIWTSNQSAD